MKILDLICKEYGITRDEFESNFKYGKLSEARHLYVAVLFSAGKRNVEIAEITGYSPARITLALRNANRLMASVPYFKKKHDALLKIFIN